MAEPQQTQAHNLPKTTDVLIVGYGPVSACLAALLGKRGIDVTVIDRADGILMMPRAIGMDHEGQRILQQVGLAENAFEKYAIGLTQLQSPRFGTFAKFITKRVLFGFSQLVMFYQPDMERALRAKVANHSSVKPFQNTSLVDLQDHGNSVSATLETALGRQHRITARYVVGADGASSTVRDLIGQTFKGRSFVEDWLIVDARNVPDPLDHVVFHCNGTNPGPQMPAPGNRQRWEFMLPANQPEGEEPSDELVNEMLKPFGGLANIEVERKAIYRFHARSADKYKVGCVFLAGDAAHITPPFIGQGLMSGLRDAINLSWKLAAVLNGQADARILETYDPERRPHAKAMINMARFMGAMVMPRNPLKALLVHGGMKLVRALPFIGAWLDSAKLMPRMKLRDGLFHKHRAESHIQPGTLFPQGFVKRASGEIVLSDVLLDGRITLVGLDTDPLAFVSPSTRAAFEQVGGHAIGIYSRGNTLPSHIDAAEDLTQEFTTPDLPRGTIAIVRPDGVILHEGLAKDADKIMSETLQLLGKELNQFSPSASQQECLT